MDASGQRRRFHRHTGSCCVDLLSYRWDGVESQNKGRDDDILDRAVLVLPLHIPDEARPASVQNIDAPKRSHNDIGNCEQLDQFHGFSSPAKRSSWRRLTIRMDQLVKSATSHSEQIRAINEYSKRLVTHAAAGAAS